MKTKYTIRKTIVYGKECYLVSRYDGKIMKTFDTLNDAAKYKLSLDKEHEKELRSLAELYREKAKAQSQVQAYSKVKSDGGSSPYYTVHTIAYQGKPKYNGGQPVDVYLEVEDLIRYMVNNDFDLGNVVKASRRIADSQAGRGKEGTDELYDWTKIKHTAEKNIQLLKGKDSERNR